MNTTTAASPSDDQPRSSAKSAGEVVSRSGLPSELGQIVLAVTGKLRLWPRERVDVARELCAHFADGLAEGRTPGELTTDFGPPQNAARLITRAKKRTRPWWYRSWTQFARACGMLLAAMIVLYVVTAIRYYVGKPSIRVDYLAQLNAAALAVPPESRAWPKYLEAYMKLPTLPVLDGRQLLLTDVKPNTPEWTAAEKYIRDNAAIVSQIRDASRLTTAGYVLSHKHGLDFGKRPGARPLPAAQGAAAWEKLDKSMQESLVAIELPHLAVYREMTRVLAFDAALAARDGDAARAVDDIRAMLALARHSNEPSSLLIGQLVGNAVFVRAAMTAEQLVIDAPALLSGEQLNEVAAMFSRWRANSVKGDDSIDVSGERMAMLDALQRLYTDNGSGDGRLANTDAARWLTAMQAGEPSFAGNAFLGPITSQLIAGRASTLRAYDDAIEAIVQRSALPLPERNARAAADEHFDNSIKRMHFLFASTMLPALDRASTHLTLAATRREAVQVGLALERYRLVNGAYPSSLRDLVPSYIASIPRDPWDGGELKYAAPKNPAARPRLYSTGHDLKDDGGDESPASPASAPPATADTPPPMNQPRDVLFWGGAM